MTNDPNVHIHVFRKRWSLILGCFFPVSILKRVTQTLVMLSAIWYHLYNLKET